MAKKTSKKIAARKPSSKALELKVKKVRELSSEDLNTVVGGFYPSTGSACFYTWSCHYRTYACC